MTGVDYNNGYIAAEGEKITALGDDTAELARLEAAASEIIDAKGRYVLPGFVDAHCHVGMWEDSVGFEGDDGNETSDPVMPHLRAIDAVYHADRAFVEARKTASPPLSQAPGAQCYRRAVCRIEDVWTQDRGYDNKRTCGDEGRLWRKSQVGVPRKRQAPMTRMATAALLRENLMKAVEYKKMKEEYERDSENSDKPDYDMKMEALLKVLNGEIPLKAHAHRADDILTAIRIAKEFGVGITIEHCTEGHLITDILLEENVSVITGPFLTDRSKIELRNQSAKTPGILAKAGVKTAIMTDHPCTPVQYLPLCAAVAVREGMDETEALRAITINPAEITGIADRVGSLETGKDADIIVMDGHPLELRSRVLYTIINGRVVRRA